jgi:PTS system mannose-specific IIA component
MIHMTAHDRRAKAAQMTQERTDGGVGVVIVTHGQLATELLNAAEMIVGDLPRFTAVSIGWHDDVTVAREAIERAIAKVDAGAGVLLLTDMFGGTPSNLGLSFLESGRVEVITGANLPMVIKLAKAPPASDLLALSRELCEHGRTAIRVASDLLRADADGRDG